MSADRNLLFGTLALQLDCINEADFTASWADCAGQGRSVGEYLVERHALTPEQRSSLDALVDALVRRDAAAAAASLARIEPPLTPLKPPDVSAPTPPPVDAGGTLLQILPARGAATLLQSRTASATRFHVVRPHARGGLGQVSVALDGELNREVALKEILGGRADDPDSRARFLLEAEVTGGLEHPGIVPVYSLGTYPDGRPFYAMRLIRGDSLHDAIQKFHASGAAFDSLDFRQLLNRFVSVCQSIAYAHARGVLHRDLKPANVMVGKYGETLVVDWGLAKARGQAPAGDGTNAERPLRPLSGGDRSATVEGRAVGTPAYMSPEQADGRLHLLEPASDIYSLGATLYELLTGKRPFAAPTVGDVLAKVRRGDFPPPHQHRAGVPRALEAVCLKAMALRPADRYASALDLAKDVERWLADEPVSAYPEPLGVRLRRWVRRHARLVTGVAAALAVGLVAVGVVGWQRELARRATQKLLAQVERTNEILGSVFVDLDPQTAEKEGKPLQAVLGERLDKATTELEGEAIGDSLAVARMQMRLGESQLGLGYPEKAVRLVGLARTTFAAQLGPDHPETLLSLSALAQSHQATGRLDLALPLAEEALTRTSAAFGPDHRGTLACMNTLAGIYCNSGQVGRGLAMIEEAYTRTRAIFGPDHRDTLARLHNLAVASLNAHRFERAVPLLEETYERTKAIYGPDHPKTLRSMNGLADGYRAAGKSDLARPLYEERLRRSQLRFGPDHPETLHSMNAFALVHFDAGRFDLALPVMEEVFRRTKAKVGPDHPDTLMSMHNLADGYRAARKYDLAAPLFEETLKLQRGKLGPDHPDALRTLNNLAMSYRAVGKLQVALPLHEESVERTRAKLGPDHPHTLASVSNLAGAYGEGGKFDRAEPLLRDLAAAAKQKSGPDSPQNGAALTSLGLNLLAQKKWAEAESVMRECLAVHEKGPPDIWVKYNTKSILGDCLLGQQKYADATPLLLDGFAGLKRRADAIQPPYRARLPEAAERLVRLYDALGKPDESAKYLDEMWAWADAPAPAKP